MGQRHGCAGRGQNHLVEVNQRSVEQVEHRMRINAEDQDDDRQRHQREYLARAQVGQTHVLIIDRPKVDALEGPQHVAGGQNRGHGAEYSQHRMELPGADQYQDFGDESRHPR